MNLTNPLRKIINPQIKYTQKSQKKNFTKQPKT